MGVGVISKFSAILVESISVLISSHRIVARVVASVSTETLHISWDQEKQGIGVTVKQSWNLAPSTIQPSEVLIVGCGSANF
jgi:hypothetical protein